MNAGLFVVLLCIGFAYSGTVKQTLGEGPSCPIDDPLQVEAGNINITLGELDGDTLILHIKKGSKHGGAVATGLSGLSYEYKLNLITLTITAKAKIPNEVCIKGDSYSADGSADVTPFSKSIFPSGDFKGTGKFQACASNFAVEGSARIFVNLITGKISLSKLELKHFSFDKVSVNLEGFTADGTTIDWADWSENFKTRFDSEFAQVGDQFIERVRKTANFHLKELTLQDLIDIIEGGDKPEPCK